MISSQGVDSVPCSIELFNCMLLLFHSYLKTENGMMVITINSTGCAIQTGYMIYTIKLFVCFNLLPFGLIVVTTLLVTDDGPKRVVVVGWICALFSVCVYAVPLGIMRLVIKTKSAKYISFSLSLFLTLCALLRIVYTLLIKDYYEAAINVIEFVFGIAKMVLYLIYKHHDETPPTMVDLEANSEMQENVGVGVVGVAEPGLVVDEAGG